MKSARPKIARSSHLTSSCFTFHASRAPHRIDQLIQQADVPLLRRDELVLHQLGGAGIDVVDAFLVILQAVLFAFLEALEGRGVAEQVGSALGELGPGAPGAGGVRGLAAELADAVADRLRRAAVLLLD